MPITTIGLGLARHWLQVHGVDVSGHVPVRRKLRRSELLAFFRSLTPSLAGMEAYATANHGARGLRLLQSPTRGPDGPLPSQGMTCSLGQVSLDGAETHPAVSAKRKQVAESIG